MSRINLRGHNLRKHFGIDHLIRKQKNDSTRSQKFLDKNLSTISSQSSDFILDFEAILSPFTSPSSHPAPSSQSSFQSSNTSEKQNGYDSKKKSNSFYDNRAVGTNSVKGSKMGEVSLNIRLVFLGGGSVGKTAIIKRFLFDTYPEKYRPTVEDLFHKEFNLGTMLLKVDFLDTAGDLQFPAMRRLSITNAQAFLLVYSISDPTSFDIIKSILEEIREAREDWQEIPIIFVGNKSDVGLEERLVLKEDVAEWVFCEMPKMKTKVMECSAKTNSNIREMFKAFLGLAKIPLPTDDCGLRRRSSAHASVASTFRSSFRRKHNPTPNTLSPTVQEDGESGSSSHSTSHLGLHSLSASTSSNLSCSTSSLKPRSRSLIRRTSKKVNKIKDPNSQPEDCTVS